MIMVDVIAMLWADVIAFYLVYLKFLADVIAKFDNGLSLIYFDG